jgi:N-acetylmuramoyl-L-alanine amidase
LADNDAIAIGDRYQYAERLVWRTVRQPAASLLHPFFQSPIKRRITMITQSKLTRTSLLSRAMILPLLFLLFCAFAARRQPHSNLRSFDSAAPVTVVIDAGHGGIDPGAINKDGLEEKNINLAIAEKINQLSAAYNVRVIMTRDADILSGNKPTKEESLHYRADLANENKADLFISIHTDMAASEYVKGFNIFITEKNAHYAQCVQLGNTLTSILQKTYTTDVALKQRTEGIYVLSNTNMPAVLLLCGNLNNEKDLSFITKDENQEKVAKDLLEGIRKYADSHPGHQ